MKPTRRQFLEGFAASVASPLLRNPALEIASRLLGMTAGEITASSTLPLASLGKIVRAFKDPLIDIYTSPDRWEPCCHIEISPQQYTNIVFHKEGASITYMEESEYRSRGSLYIKGLTKNKLIQAIPATKGEVIDLTPQGMHAVGVDILTPGEWKELSDLHMWQRMFGYEPDNPFVQSAYEQIERTPALLKTPETHPELAQKFLEKRRLWAEADRRALAAYHARIADEGVDQSAVDNALTQTGNPQGKAIGQRILNSIPGQAGKMIEAGTSANDTSSTDRIEPNVPAEPAAILTHLPSITAG
jgi:hypothetical protein